MVHSDILFEQIAPAANEPTCGQPTPDGPCWRVAGHMGPCKG